ncbi:hypothetical protein FRC07_005758 [Ceratobasidium sp. 392]|nr:hypothetical protein FRC07_005758 [Ceratobasidium sp. 392]
MGLTAASVATALGFEAATRGTQLGFRVTRGITSAVAYNSTALAEHVVFGGPVGAASAIGSAINSAFSFAESLALAPIQFGHNLASTSLVAASSSLDLLVWLFGTQEVGFSLTEFGVLIQREWTNPPGMESLPEERYGAASIARALVTWAALQDATSVWGMKRSLKGAKEIPMNVWKGQPPSNGTNTAQAEESKDDSDEWEIIVTSDEKLPDDGGTLIQAQISHFRPPGAYVWAEPEAESQDTPEAEIQDKSPARRSTSPSMARRDSKPISTPVVDWAHLRPTLRRMSHMVIGGYGGASFLFFGLAFPSAGEAAASAQPPETSSPSRPTPQRGQTVADVVHKAESEARAPASQQPAEPRRTYSLNELAIDLTCDPVPFVPAREKPIWSKPDTPSNGQHIEDDEPHFVHGGMLKTAELMGLQGKPVHTAVANALRANRGYELILTGHSLGAGVASLLALA